MRVKDPVVHVRVGWQKLRRAMSVTENWIILSPHNDTDPEDGKIIFSHMALWLMMIYHNTKSGYGRLSDLKYIAP